MPPKCILTKLKGAFYVSCVLSQIETHRNFAYPLSEKANFFPL